MKNLYLVDGSGFVFRAFHALPPLTSPQGTPVGAVYGFCQMMTRLIQTLHGDPVLVVFDKGRATFRTKLYPEYKAHRPPAPEALIPQFPLIRQACTALGIPFIEQEGFEADDLIASYAYQGSPLFQKITIISSDKDLMQLVDGNIVMWDPIKEIIIDISKVQEKMGVSPKQVPDYLALVGDRSDGIPGVPSIGPKTAAELLKQFQNLEGIYEKASEIPQVKRREILYASKDQAFLSLQLATVLTDLPLLLPWENIPDCSSSTPVDLNFFSALGFNRLVRTRTQNLQNDPAECLIIETPESLDTWLTSVHEFGMVSCVMNSPSLLFLATKKDEICQQICLEIQPWNQELLKNILIHPGILKIGHDVKALLHRLRLHHLEITPYDDLLSMSYTLDTGRYEHSVEALTSRYLDRVISQDAYAMAFLDIYPLLRKRLVTEGMMTLYERVERPLARILAKMESIGMCIDTTTLQKIGHEWLEKKQNQEDKIYILAGHVFNLASPKQVSSVLFDELNLPPPSKTKSGYYKTDGDVLENLSHQGYDIATHILEWRSLTKLHSTYVEGLLKACDPVTHKIHTSFSLAGTSTGRLSSSEPNIQNIPVRTFEGRRIRSVFIPSQKDNVLVSFDYSQIELRLLAHFADIPTLKDAFQHNLDVHTITASHVWDIPLNDVTSDQRRQAKIVNFGILYGMGAYGLSQQLGISFASAKTTIDTYLERYPGISTYMETQKNIARAQGYVTTLLGRKCYTPHIHDKNMQLRQFAERQAMNAPLQGSNADIIKKAMISIDAAILSTKDIYMITQVHDELVFDVARDKLHEWSTRIQGMMEGIVKISIPLKVDVRSGTNWENTH